MKKFYTLLVAAATTLSALAATQSLSVPAKQKALNTADLEIGQLVRQGGDVVTVTPLVGEIVPNLATKNAMRSPAATTDLVGDWDCTYTGMLNNNVGPHEETATFTWMAQYQQFAVSIPGCQISPFYADYDAATGKLTFNLELLGEVAEGIYVAQWPMIGTAVQKAVTATYDADTKSIKFDNPNAALAMALLKGTTPNDMYGYNWAGIGFTFTRPEGDFGLKVQFKEECTPDNEFQFNLTAGADIAKIMMVTWEGGAAASDFADILGEEYINALGQEVNAGTYDFKPAQFMDESGYYTVMAFGYDAQGKLRKKTEDLCFIVLNEDDDYVKIADVPFTDELVSVYYNNFSNIKESVELQENINQPGLFRYVDPYLGQKSFHADGCAHYIYLDTRDPQFVNIPASATGLDFGDGVLVYTTLGSNALGYTKEDCDEEGLPYGTMNGRKVTFPERSILAHEKRYDAPASWSYMNTKTTATFTLPDLVLNLTIYQDENQTTPLDGVSVTITPLNDEGSVALIDDAQSAVTDAEGKVSITLPATIDYLSKVLVNATDAKGVSNNQEVQLAGATNNLTLYAQGLTSGVDTIEADGTQAVEYFNLQGVRIDNPRQGELIIRKQGSNVSKVLVK